MKKLRTIVLQPGGIKNHTYLYVRINTYNNCFQADGQISDPLAIKAFMAGGAELKITKSRLCKIYLAKQKT
jgi:hypothetical protein